MSIVIYQFELLIMSDINVKVCRSRQLQLIDH